MAALAKLHHTAGDTTQHFVDYSNTVRRGDWITNVVVTTPATDVSITGVAIYEPNKITFFVSGGAVNEVFIVSLVLTENNSEVNTDTIEFHVVAP